MLVKFAENATNELKKYVILALGDPPYNLQYYTKFHGSYPVIRLQSLTDYDKTMSQLARNFVDIEDNKPIDPYKIKQHDWLKEGW